MSITLLYGLAFISWIAFTLEKKNQQVESTSSFSYSSAAIDHLMVFKISDDDNDVAADENTHY